MSKVIFKEKQHYHQPLAYLLLSVFMVLVLVKIASMLFQPDFQTGMLLTGIAIALILISIFVYLRNISMTVRLNGKNIKIKVKGVPFSKSKKIPLSQIESMEFYSPSEASLLSGWLVNFSSVSDSSVYNFGDKKLVHIHTRNGRSHLLFSDKLFEEKKRLGKLITEA